MDVRSVPNVNVDGPAPLGADPAEAHAGREVVGDELGGNIRCGCVHVLTVARATYGPVVGWAAVTRSDRYRPAAGRLPEHLEQLQ